MASSGLLCFSFFGTGPALGTERCRFLPESGGEGTDNDELSWDESEEEEEELEEDSFTARLYRRCGS